MVAWRSCGALRMAITVSASVDIEIAVTKHDATSGACKAPRMILSAHVRLQILAFNAAITGAAQRSVELMVMMFTVRRVLEDIEFRGRERACTSSANKTLFVIATSKTAGGVLDRLPDNGLRASPAVSFAWNLRSTDFGLSGIVINGAWRTPSWYCGRVDRRAQFTWTSSKCATLDGRIHGRFRWVRISWR